MLRRYVGGGASGGEDQPSGVGVIRGVKPSLWREELSGWLRRASRTMATATGTGTKGEAGGAMGRMVGAKERSTARAGGVARTSKILAQPLVVLTP